MTPRRQKTMRRLTSIFLSLSAICWLATPAQALWQTTAAGSATAKSPPLAAPTNLRTSCGLLSASIRLDWDPSGSPWTVGYEVRRGTATGVYTTDVIVTPTALTYTTPALGTGTYYFVVRATTGDNWRSGVTNEANRLIVSVLGVAACL